MINFFKHSKNGSRNVECLNKALEDEPLFIILGRDPDAAAIVRLWADRRAAAGDPEHAEHVYGVVDAMTAWRADGHRSNTAPPAEAYPQTVGVVEAAKDVLQFRIKSVAEGRGDLSDNDASRAAIQRLHDAVHPTYTRLADSDDEEEPQFVDPGGSFTELLQSFADQNRDGAAGCTMDWETARALALAIEAKL